MVEIFDRHQKDQSTRGVGQSVPIVLGIFAPGSGVTGGNRHGAGQPTVGDRDACGGRHGEAGADTWYDLARNARLTQGEDFLATSAEHEGVAPFQADDAFSFEPESHEQPIDLLLRARVSTGSLANIKALGICSAKAEDLRPDQPIVDDGISFLKSAQTPQSQELRIARSGPDERDETHAVGDRMCWI